MSQENLNTESAASFLGVADNTLEKWRVYGRGPRFVKVGRSVIYRRRDLESYLDARSCSSTSEAAALNAPNRHHSLAKVGNGNQEPRA